MGNVESRIELPRSLESNVTYMPTTLEPIAVAIARAIESIMNTTLTGSAKIELAKPLVDRLAAMADALIYTESKKPKPL